MTNLFRILHLSDLHFGPNFCLRDKSSPDDPRKWAADLAADIEQGLDDNRVRDTSREGNARQFDLLVVSGDLTCKFDAEGMRAAEFFFDDVQGKGGGRGRWWSADDLLLIPGNHDMVFGDKPSHSEMPRKIINLPRERREELYRSTYQNITGKRLGKLKTVPADDSLGLAKISHEHRLIILGLDSCRLESWATPGMGFVGFDQVQALCEATALMRLHDSDAPMPWHLLAFLHHNITRMSQPGGADMREVLNGGHDRGTWDGEEITKSLKEYGVDFILHGHFHQADLRARENLQPAYGRILSAGSAGVEGSHCEYQHHFFVLEVQSEEGSSRRSLKVTSLQRPIIGGIPGRWDASSKIFPLSENPQVDMTPETLNERLYRAKHARSEYQTHESWPLAVLFLTEMKTNDQEWGLRLPEVEAQFAAIWNKRREKLRELPVFKEAFDLLLRQVQLEGDELLREFTRELDGDDPVSLAAFLVTKALQNLDFEGGE